MEEEYMKKLSRNSQKQDWEAWLWENPHTRETYEKKERICVNVKSQMDQPNEVTLRLDDDDSWTCPSTYFFNT